MNFVETLIHEGNRIAIVSGEGSVGAVETYHGARTMRAIKERLTRQIVSGVRWADSIRALIALGVERFIEAGSGTVLAGMMKRIDKRFKVLAAGKPEEIAAMADAEGK